VFPFSISMEALSRLSRGSVERHVSQSQPIDGTPVDVPVPRSVSLMSKSYRRELG